MHTVAQPLTPDGRVIENNGVVPDLKVRLDRESLLKGETPQLQVAIEYINRIAH